MTARGGGSLPVKEQGSRKVQKSPASSSHAPARAISSHSDSSDQPETDDDCEPKRRRRIVTRDPNRPPPKAWSAEEVEKFKNLIEREGPTGWERKAVQLGSGRSAKALHTRWLREQGRIVDRPRQVLTAGNANVVEQNALEALMMMSS